MSVEVQSLKKATCKTLQKSSSTFQSELLGSEIRTLSFLFRVEMIVLAELEMQTAGIKTKDGLSTNVLVFVPDAAHMFVRMFYSQLFHRSAFRAGINRPLARAAVSVRRWGPSNQEEQLIF